MGIGIVHALNQIVEACQEDHGYENGFACRCICPDRNAETCPLYLEYGRFDPQEEGAGCD